MNRVELAAKKLAQGEIILVSDDHERENEGDLVMAAQHATPEKVAFFVKHTGGILCVPMSEERALSLNIPPMVRENTDPRGTAFTVSVDAKNGITTGVSAADRAKTIQLLAAKETVPEDFTRPGHIFPLIGKRGGTLKRGGHTESAIDLLEIAGCTPVGLISEVTNEDGTVSKGKELDELARQHDLLHITVAEIVAYRRKKEKLVEQTAVAALPTKYGEFTSYVYRSKLDGIEHFALVMGSPTKETPTLVRVHSECLTGDIFGSKRCDCGLQLEAAEKRIAEEGAGVLLYLRGQEGRGIGLTHKIRAYSLQEKGLDTVDANVQLGLPVDSREYGIGAQILSDLGVGKIRLMTNNPAKYSGLEGYDLEILERIPLLPASYPESETYMKTKKEKMGHLL